MVKKLLIVMLFLFVFVVTLTGEVIKNSKNPISKNAGRVLKFKEILRIEDDPVKGFVLEYPREVRFAPDGTMFLRDRKNLYQLNKQGELLRNYTKQGEGPGEIKYLGGFAFFDDTLFIEGFSPLKLMEFDLKGNFKNENRINDDRRLELHFYNDKNLFFIHNSFPKIKNNQGFVDNPNILTKKSLNQDKIEEVISFPNRSYIVKSKGGGGGMMSVAFLKSVLMDSKYLCVSNTEEYWINLVDLSQGKIVLKFNRDYERIRLPADYKPQGGITINNKKMVIPGRKYFVDIEKLIKFKNHLWVITSTKDKVKGKLIDVFNLKGQYLDNFYYNLEGRILGANKDCIFVSQKDEEENLTIVKYQVMN